MTRGRWGTVRRRAGGAALALVVLLMGAACIPREGSSAGKLAALPVGKIVLKEVLGATVYLIRQPDDRVVVYWGISPLRDPSGGRVQCMLIARNPGAGGEGLPPFVDPCRNAAWDYDGGFLGYRTDAGATPTDGPALERIGADVVDGRVRLDAARLQCLQNRDPTCG